MKTLINFIAIAVIFGSTLTIGQLVDLTRTPGASGPEVVEAVLDIIRKSCIFPDDHSFLRRVAYVDSADGTQNFTYRNGYHGGIWQIDEGTFDQTKTEVGLEPYRQQIESQLLINWTAVTWQDLRKPLYSGIAAELALLNGLGGASVPVTIENQAVVWADGINQPNVFVSRVSELNKARTSYNDVDVVFLLDSSSSLSKEDFNKTKDFTEKVIDGFDINGGKVKVAVLEYSSVPKLIFGLNSNMTKGEVLAEVANMTYMPGGTNTKDAFQYVKDNVFLNGSRPGSSKIIILVTDGRSNDKPSTVLVANQLKTQGVTIFAVGVGSLVDQKELSAVASSPDCIYMKTVSNFTELSSINYEIQQLSLKETVNLAPGVYTFDCDSNLNVRIASNNGQARTIEVISPDGRTYIYGSGSPDYTPNSAIYTFTDIAAGPLPVQFFVRDGSEVFLAFRNTSTGGCKSKFQLKVLVGDHIKTDSHVTCIENRLISNCTPTDLILSPLVLTGTPGPLLPDFCTSQRTEIFPHPTESDRYIYCSGGKMIIVFCNPGDKFDKTVYRCVYAPPTVTSNPSQMTSSPPTNPITNPVVTSQTGGSTVTISPPGGVTPFINPCTPDNILKGLMVWPYPPDKTRFIHCDVFPFSGSIQSCPSHKYYEHSLQTCLYAEVVIDPSQSTFSGVANPCVKDFKGDVQYHEYPGDNHRFIQCDAFGDAFVKQCDRNEIWQQAILNCIPTGFRFDTVPPVAVGK